MIIESPVGGIGRKSSFNHCNTSFEICEKNNNSNNINTNNKDIFSKNNNNNRNDNKNNESNTLGPIDRIKSIMHMIKYRAIIK